MRKKFLSVLLTLAMVLTMVPATAFAATAAIKDGTIDGKVGTALENKSIVVTLTDDTTTAAATTVDHYTLNTPAGISIDTVAATDGGTEITINLTGTPTATSEDTITLTIAADALTGATELEVTENANAKWAIAKADGPAAPTGLAGVAPTTEDGSDGKITGTDATMEYKADSDFAAEETGTACAATETTGLAAGTYYVRVAATATTEAGASVEVEVPAFSAGAAAVAAPTFTPAAGEVESGTTVAIACATEGAKIYYTVKTADELTDDAFKADPATEGTEYAAAIEITEATTIRAIAVKEAESSEMATAAYTIKAAEAEVPTATIEDVTIDGTAGEALAADKTIVITVANGTIVAEAAAVADNYVLNAPEGVTIKTAAVEGQVITLTLEGTPAASCADAITVTIKAAVITEAKEDVVATANANAKWAIAAATIKAEIEAGETTTTLGEGIPETGEDKDLADEVKTAIEGAAAPIVAADDLGDNAGEATVSEINTAIEAVDGAAIKAENTDVTKINAAAELETRVLTYVDIEITDSKAADGTITLDITPMYQVIAVSADDVTTDGAVELLDAEGTNKATANAIAVGEAKEMTVTGSVDITVPLGASFAEGDYFVIHKDKYVYAGAVDGSNILTFTSTNGFSPFKVTSENPAAATVGGVGYTSLADAIAAVTDGGTVILEKNVDAEVTVAMPEGVKTFTIDANGKDGADKITVTAPVGFETVEDAGVYSLKLKAPVIKANGSAVSSNAYTDEVSVTIELAAAVEGAKIYYTIDGGAEIEYTGAITVTAEDLKATISAVAKMDPPVAGIANSDAATATIKVKESSNDDDDNNGGSSHRGGGSHSLDEIKGGRYDNLPKEDDEKPVVGTDVDPSNPFVDVATSDPYYEAIMEVYKKGWMVGISDNTFASSGTLTRGMAAQILWNKAGNPSPTNVSPFLDVTSDKWYATAVAWAYEQGLVLGYDGTTFGPDDFVTTEQFTIMLDKAAGRTPAPYVGGAANATRGWVANEIVK